MKGKRQSGSIAYSSHGTDVSGYQRGVDIDIDIDDYSRSPSAKLMDGFIFMQK